jgi:hypothetical protein
VLFAIRFQEDVFSALRSPTEVQTVEHVSSHAEDNTKCLQMKK